MELKERLEKYLKRADNLFDGVQKSVPENVDMEKVADKVYEMATSYYKDAYHFYEKGRYIDSLAALEYAEGWLDCGKLIGVLK